ncbi:hypothetical protein llap_11209 [Limosa lapponica baueri]|uniref:RNase H type-1 domain-containing protein n=1 Tax=Limosa lapponica baueri TaxID=1758121 RepID=A0A2I0TXE3_LIMLA|nr:hypothetical protein llap_11209 [Limosa lapponica baueri]
MARGTLTGFHGDITGCHGDFACGHKNITCSFWDLSDEHQNLICGHGDPAGGFGDLTGCNLNLIGGHSDITGCHRGIRARTTAPSRPLEPTPLQEALGLEYSFQQLSESELPARRRIWWLWRDPCFILQNPLREITTSDMLAQTFLIASDNAASESTVQLCIQRTTRLFHACLENRKNVALVWRDVDMLIIQRKDIKMTFYIDFLKRLNGTEKMLQAVLEMPQMRDLVVSCQDTAASQTSSGRVIILPGCKLETVPNMPSGKAGLTGHVKAPPEQRWRKGDGSGEKEDLAEKRLLCRARLSPNQLPAMTVKSEQGQKAEGTEPRGRQLLAIQWRSLKEEEEKEKLIPLAEPRMVDFIAINIKKREKIPDTGCCSSPLTSMEMEESSPDLLETMMECEEAGEEHLTVHEDDTVPPKRSLSPRTHQALLEGVTCILGKVARERRRQRDDERDVQDKLRWHSPACAQRRKETGSGTPCAGSPTEGKVASLKAWKEEQKQWEAQGLQNCHNSIELDACQNKVIMVEQDDVEIVVTNLVNPASFLEGNMGKPVHHDCLETIEATYSSRLDLKDSPLDNAENWFTDGSSYVLSGERHAGYAITTSQGIIESGPLPINTSVQKAEIIALTCALELAQGKAVNIYTDSKYVFGVVHTQGAIWIELTRKKALSTQRRS